MGTTNPIDTLVEELGKIPNCTWKAKVLNSGPIIRLSKADAKKPYIFRTGEPLDDGLIEESRAAERYRGFEAIAWYESFHNEEDWGIFIRLAGLESVAQFVSAATDMPEEKAYLEAYKIITDHEVFHFAMDQRVAFWEIVTQKACSAVIRERKKQNSKRYIEVEEKLANSYMLGRQKDKNLRRAIEEWIKPHPPGYKDAKVGLHYPEAEFDFSECINTYCGMVALEHGLEISGANTIFSKLFDGFERKNQSHCPVNFIQDANSPSGKGPWLEYISAIPTIRESQKFQKSLQKLGPEVSKKWKQLKVRVASQLPSTFEKLKGFPSPTWSLRVNQNIRVHLERRPDAWHAVAIGNHKEMGHG